MPYTIAVPQSINISQRISAVMSDLNEKYLLNMSGHVILSILFLKTRKQLRSQH